MSDEVADLASKNDLTSQELISMYSKVGDALRAKFGSIDSGLGGTWADFWVADNGIEYKLVLTLHRATQGNLQ